MNKEREAANKSKAMEDDDNGVALSEDDYVAATVLGNLLTHMKLDEKAALELGNMRRGFLKYEEPSPDIDGRNEILESNQDVSTDDEEGSSRPYQKRRKRARLLLEENENQESMEIEQEKNVAKETLTPDDSQGKTAP
ncbi:hypothetical protein V6N13_141251 [Hibiscus sabdariffa]|uniref:Uncharacterized protein n=1 Tax=Hibiscus sabdariffa TaxID=183260 RepID=A0ABR2Q0T6_9ROSI